MKKEGERNTRKEIGSKANNSVQGVALIDRGYGELQEVKGIPVDIRSDKYPSGAGAGRYTLTRDGLINVRNSGMHYDNPVEGTHVNSVILVPVEWDEINKLTGMTKANVDKAFDEFEQPEKAVDQSDVSSDRQKEGHNRQLEGEWKLY